MLRLLDVLRVFLAVTMSKSAKAAVLLLSIPEAQAYLQVHLYNFNYEDYRIMLIETKRRVRYKCRDCKEQQQA